MVCLGIEPGAAGWKARTNPLSYGGTPFNTNVQLNITSLLLVAETLTTSDKFIIQKRVCKNWNNWALRSLLIK